MDRQAVRRRARNAVWAGAACAAALVVLAPSSEGSAQQTRSLLSAGGARMTGGAYVANGNVGDVVAGVSQLGATVIEHGFWSGVSSPPVAVEPGWPLREQLRMPAPNPARAAIGFGLELPRATRTRIRVCDVSGRTVRTLFDGVMNPGVIPLQWDLRLPTGDRVPPGLYFILMSTAERLHSRRFIVLDR